MPDGVTVQAIRIFVVVPLVCRALLFPFVCSFSQLTSRSVQVSETRTVTEITVDGVRCATYGPDTHPEEEALRERLLVQCQQVVRGREVKIARVRVSKAVDPAPLQLCEVEIWSKFF